MIIVLKYTNIFFYLFIYKYVRVIVLLPYFVSPSILPLFLPSSSYVYPRVHTPAVQVMFVSSCVFVKLKAKQTKRRCSWKYGYRYGAPWPLAEGPKVDTGQSIRQPSRLWLRPLPRLRMEFIWILIKERVLLLLSPFVLTSAVSWTRCTLSGYP